MAYSVSFKIITVVMVASPAGVVAPTSLTPLQPLAVLTPPSSPEALSEWSEELALAAEGLQQRCGQVAGELKAFRKDGTSMGGGAPPMGLGLDEASMLPSTQDGSRTAVELAKLSDVLGGLKDMESHVQSFLAAMRSAEGLENNATCTIENATCTTESATDKGLTTLPGVRDRFLVCLLGVVGKARGLLGAEDDAVSWAAVESIAVEEAQANLNSPDVQFGLGLYWSDVGLASSDSSGSSDAWWVRDNGGASAPPQMVRAETLLQESQLATESTLERKNRAATRALRLYQHADFMARKHHVAAAVWRYRSAAKLASGSRRSRMPMHGLEMHALTRLAYFLDRSGKDTEALAAANDALAVQHKSATSRIPLAKYLHATIRRRLGELRTDRDVLDAEAQLLAVKGKLPSQTLENERASAHAEFVAWRNVAEAPAWSSTRVQRCVEMTDAARVLICMLCSAVFP